MNAPDQTVAPRILRSADLRFAGQGFEVVTTLPAGPYGDNAATLIGDAFKAVYLQTFSQVPPAGDIEIVNIRVAVSADVQNTVLDASAPQGGRDLAREGEREVWVGAWSRYADVPVYRRERLAVGAEIAGPAVVQEASSTLVLPAGSRSVVDASGSLIVQLAPAGQLHEAPAASAAV